MPAFRTRARRVAAGLALSSALLGATAAVASADATTDYSTGLALGQQAYQYGLPLLDTNRVHQTQTSINVPDRSGDGPVNQFHSVPKLTVPTASQKTVVAPNEDTLYSLAWLDLSHQPQVIHVPAIKHRFYVIPLYTPFTENFYNITSDTTGPAGGAYGVTHGGNYAVVPPGFHGTLPHGVTRVDSPYTRVWIIGRTLIRGASDTSAVNRIQAGYSITPLSKFGRTYKPKAATHPKRTLTIATIPGTQAGQNPLAFYTALGRELEMFKPPAADRPLLDQLKTIDVGPGLDPATDPHLSAATLQGMRAAIANGPAGVKTELTQTYLHSVPKHNGYLVLPLGHYGTNYELRAIADTVGLGALTPDVAIYPLAQTDMTLGALTGTKSYVLHIPADGLPPVHGFWSLTMYDPNGFFVPNPLGRYVINDRSRLHHNADGSLDIYIQANQPTNPKQAQNWLPAPAGNFRLIWRLYDTGSAKAGTLNGSGWQPPKIQPCMTGVGPLGTACAY
ncbi:MAG TPA: DUF1254 domain-containing protein [Solirubrobacteraceae bacterium]|jgi:hypothetical protein|nr:DUF1254 domain-containing protein [Solirubrobacteraceae bacterium]